MTLEELTIGAYIYSNFSNYDKDYNKIRDKEFDFSSEDQFDSLFEFLRKWGCRQFAKIYDEERKSQLITWFNKYHSTLPDKGKSILNLSDYELRSYSQMIQDLMDCIACFRMYKNKNIKHPVRFAHVGAAKTLLVIRKNVFPPWDGPIIQNLKTAKNPQTFSCTGSGYCEYLIFVKHLLEKIQEEISDINRLPILVNRPNSSPPKIIDEYLWVTKTRGINVETIINLIRKN